MQVAAVLVFCPGLCLYGLFKADLLLTGTDSVAGVNFTISSALLFGTICAAVDPVAVCSYPPCPLSPSPPPPFSIPCVVCVLIYMYMCVHVHVHLCMCHSRIIQEYYTMYIVYMYIKYMYIVYMYIKYMYMHTCTCV